MWHINSNKHKAQHCGYKKKPSKKEVNALLNLFAGVSILPDVKHNRKIKKGIQLKLF